MNGDGGSDDVPRQGVGDGSPSWSAQLAPDEMRAVLNTPEQRPSFDKGTPPLSATTRDGFILDGEDVLGRKRPASDSLHDEASSKSPRLFLSHEGFHIEDEEELSEPQDYADRFAEDRVLLDTNGFVTHDDHFLTGEGLPGEPEDEAGDDYPEDSEGEDSSDLDTDDDEVDFVINQLLAEMNEGSFGADPLEVLEGFLRKHAIDPAEVMTLLNAAGNLSVASIARALVAFMRIKGSRSFLPMRELVVKVDGIESVVDLIRRSKKILVLSGAGVSVSCGIPDFRSPGGLYDTVRDQFGLEEPQALFDIEYFKSNPNPFFTLAKDIFPGGRVRPSVAHDFVRRLETDDRLLRNYTQNIDGLENIAGVERVIPCHGSFATATCRRCKRKVNGEEVRDDIFKSKIPFCGCVEVVNGKAADGGESPILKPDIVFFGEPLVEAFFQNVNKDLEDCDLMIVMGTSLKVAPVSRLPSLLGKEVPRILINREVVGTASQRFDVELLGDCDEVVHSLHSRLWGDAENKTEGGDRGSHEFVGPNRFLFKGAKVE